MQYDNVTVTNLGFLLTVQCPYSKSFNTGAKSLGGQWNPHERYWEFHPKFENTINQLISRCFTLANCASASQEDQTDPPQLASLTPSRTALGCLLPKPIDVLVEGHWRQQKLRNGRTKRVWVRAHKKKLG